MFDAKHNLEMAGLFKFLLGFCLALILGSLSMIDYGLPPEFKIISFLISIFLAILIIITLITGCALALGTSYKAFKLDRILSIIFMVFCILILINSYAILRNSPGLAEATSLLCIAVLIILLIISFYFFVILTKNKELVKEYLSTKICVKCGKKFEDPIKNCSFCGELLTRMTSN
jgi:predicted ferric reductase